MKNFIANIPFFLSFPFQYLSKGCTYCVMKLVILSGTIHKAFKTPTGLRLAEAEKNLMQLETDLKAIQELSKKMAVKKKQASDPTLANIISSEGKNGPTFH